MEEFKEGQRVFDSAHGELTIFKIGNNGTYPIKAGSFSYTLDGERVMGSKHPSLFHSPKDAAEYFAKIPWTKEVTVEWWTNVYLDAGFCVYPTEEIANKHAGKTRIACEHFKKTYVVDSSDG